MTTSDDQSQPPWSDPQTHVDTDPVNAAPPPDTADAGGTADSGSADAETDEVVEDDS